MAAADDTYLDEAYDEGIDHAHAGEIVQWYAKRPVTVSTAAATSSLVGAFALGVLTTIGALAVMRLYDEDAATKSLEKAVSAGLDGITMVLMVDGDHERMVDMEASLCDEICVAHGATALPATVGETWWNKRYDFYHPPHAPELPQIWATMDAVSDFTHIEALYTNVTRALRESIDPKWKMTLKTHLSHWFDWGAMIYPRVIIPAGPDDLDSALELHDGFVRAASLAALESGGVINDHHGVGMRLAPHLGSQFGEAGMALLRGVKAGIDPNHILCPGKMGMGQQ